MKDQEINRAFLMEEEDENAEMNLSNIKRQGRAGKFGSGKFIINIFWFVDGYEDDYGDYGDED